MSDNIFSYGLTIAVFKKPEMIQKRVTNITKVRNNFFKSPRAPFNFRFNNNEKNEKETNKKHTNYLLYLCFQIVFTTLSAFYVWDEN